MGSEVPTNLALTTEDHARAEVYALLGALLAQPPGEALLAALRELRIERGNGEDVGMAAAWALMKRAAEEASGEELAQEYQELFIGIGRGELVPYGSWYLTGFLMEKPLAELRADLSRLGIERRAEVKEPEDHAAALCETMSLLLTHGVEVAAQRAFFERHLAPWLGRFFADLAQARAARFYRSVALLGGRFMEVESAGLSMPG